MIDLLISSALTLANTDIPKDTPLRMPVTCRAESCKPPSIANMGDQQLFLWEDEKGFTLTYHNNRIASYVSLPNAMTPSEFASICKSISVNQNREFVVTSKLPVKNQMGCVPSIVDKLMKEPNRTIPATQQHFSFNGR
jgi:hypothetical protein